MEEDVLMIKYRIRINTSRNYSGYFWDVEEYRQTKKQEGYWSSVRGGYAFTKWGASRIAKRAARKYLMYQPFEKIEEIK
jgi:hypothetical protein